ncbi:hypothetical protein BHE90_013086 [Fusarium euwallaceae]|nr:hypothetical protein BHE90_013086 [Fusarium euwallaceae]
MAESKAPFNALFSSEILKMPDTYDTLTEPSTEPGQASNMTRERRRCSQSCQFCRSKKIRCDVWETGIPCTNCRRRRSNCVIPPKIPRRPPIRTALSDMDHTYRDQPTPVAAVTGDHEARIHPSVRSTSSAEGLDPSLTFKDLMDMSEFSWPLSNVNLPSIYGESTTNGDNLEAGSTEQSPSTITNNQMLYGEESLESGLGSNAPQEHAVGDVGQSPSLPLDPLFRRSNYERPLSFVLLTCYRFIDIGNLWQLSAEETASVETRGCLHLPPRLALDEFVRHYFLFVHPTLPVLDEGRFWALYSWKAQKEPPHAAISPMLFHAMLFVSCSHVPVATLNRLGFETVQAATREFYTRAKARYIACSSGPLANSLVLQVLFDSSLSVDEVTKAQTALLMTHCSSAMDDTTDTYWLVTAIHFSRSARADQWHMYVDAPSDSLKLKRLWWSCILRDRVMALSFRRPMTIKPSEIDPSKPFLTADDFSDELRARSVYNTPTKRTLVQLIVCLCELLVNLSSVFDVLFPQISPSNQYCSREKMTADLKACLSKVDSWFKTRASILEGTSSQPSFPHSITLFTKILTLYYHTARTLICHRKMPLMASENEVQVEAIEDRRTIRLNLDASLQELNQDLGELVNLGLVRNLPNHFIALLAFPFAWDVLSCKIPNDERQRPQTSTRTWDKAMQTFHGAYSSTADIFARIEDILKNVNQMDIPQPSEFVPNIYWPSPSDPFLPAARLQLHRPPPTDNFWVELVAAHPQTYHEIS